MDPISLGTVVNVLVDKIIEPKISQFATKCGMQYNKIMVPRGEHFKEYLHRSYKKLSIVNTLVLKNAQHNLVDLFIPMTITVGYDEKSIHQIIDAYTKSFIENYQRLLITDTAGMGKSTLSKRMFIDVIENGHGIPIFIELRKLSKEKTVIKEILEQVSPLVKDFDKDLLLELIATGGFIFFLDGYDEVSSTNIQFVTQDIQDFISKAGDNTFILTSRPENTLASFGDFQDARIEPLKKKEAYELLRKYDNQGEISKLLIENLKTGRYQIIDDFLGNPLLVSLLFLAYSHKQTIPIKKHLFYRQVFDAFFDSYDLSKGDGYVHEKKSNLDIDDFDCVLRHIGFLCLKEQKIAFEKDVFLKIINQAKLNCGDISFCVSDLASDLIGAVPLFCIDGQEYKWAHKSLQEYFAAQFIFKDSKYNQGNVLTAIYESDNFEKYYNLLDIYYDVDYNGFARYILYPYLKRFVEYYDEHIFQSDEVPLRAIQDRIAHLYLRDIDIFNDDQYKPNQIFRTLRVGSASITNTSVSGIKVNVLQCNRRKARLHDLLITRGHVVIKSAKYKELSTAILDFKKDTKICNNFKRSQKQLRCKL